MEAFFKVLPKLNNKQEYLGYIFPFFIITMNNAAKIFQEFKTEGVDKIEEYQKNYVKYFEVWGSKLLGKCFRLIKYHFNLSNKLSKEI